MRLLFTRRPLAALCVALFAQCVACGVALADEISILSWEGYADDSFVKPFVQQTGCKVSATYVGSNDEFIAKVISGGGNYDLVTP